MPTDIFSKFIEVINQWAFIESQENIYRFTKGVVSWWYSPSMDYFAPEYPYNLKRPLYGRKDWIFIAKTLDGEVIYSGITTSTKAVRNDTARDLLAQSKVGIKRKHYSE